MGVLPFSLSSLLFPRRHVTGTIIRATIVYWILLILLRLIGRRAVSQQSPFEFIVIFLLGGMSIQSIVSDDRSLFNAVLGIFAIAVNHFVASFLRERFVGFRKLIEGIPVVVARDGEMDTTLLHGLRMLPEDVMAAARQSGIKHLSQIELAIVERNGRLTIFKRE
jgi:uncharacterized membrane protein YcaP (DUF421 family)